MFLDEKKKRGIFWSYEHQVRYDGFVALLNFVFRPIGLIIHAVNLRKCITKEGPGSSTFSWKGKHYEKEKYIGLRTQELCGKGYDLEYLNELLEKAIEYPGQKLNEYEAEALKRAIEFTKSYYTYYSDKQEDVQ